MFNQYFVDYVVFDALFGIRRLSCKRALSSSPLSYIYAKYNTPLTKVITIVVLVYVPYYSRLGLLCSFLLK